MKPIKIRKRDRIHAIRMVYSYESKMWHVVVGLVPETQPSDHLRVECRWINNATDAEIVATFCDALIAADACYVHVTYNGWEVYGLEQTALPSATWIESEHTERNDDDE